MSATNAVRFENVDVIFGQRSKEALALLDKGEGRDSILDKTGIAGRRARRLALRQ